VERSFVVAGIQVLNQLPISVVRMRLELTAFLLLLAAAPASAQSAAEQIALADREYTSLNAAGALSDYEKALAIDPRSFEALWKASRSAVDIGSYSPDAGRRAALFSNAEQYARRAISVNPDNAEGHFALARALGKTALMQSPRGRVKYATAIRSQALACLKFDPVHAGCLHVMGIWNAEVMRLNGFTRMLAKNFLGGKVFETASWTNAVSYMERSVAADPQRIVHHLDLAGVYHDVGEKSKAKTELETVLRLPVTDVNDRHYKDEARAALAAL
jgi:tetratricopeptide (TPR) repeat protein